jgi:purine-binding chemotaxis protein CheW
MDTHAGNFGFGAKRIADQLVVFMLDAMRYALRLSCVERIVRVVEIAALPEAPEIVLGLVNVGGEIVPVVNVRKRFGLPERELGLNSHLVIARTTRRKVALAVDAAIGVVEGSEENTTAGAKILPHMDYVQGVVRLDDGLVLIHDLDTFLSLEEEETLEQAMKLN